MIEEKAAAMLREDAREAWAASGLSHDDLTPGTMEALRKAINAELSTDRPIRGMCCRAKPTIRRYKDGSVDWADLRCAAYYFTDRQAVTFERTGFVGFAGWASDENVQPILRGFVKWVEACVRGEDDRAIQAIIDTPDDVILAEAQPADAEWVQRAFDRAKAQVQQRSGGIAAASSIRSLKTKEGGTDAE